MIRNLSPLNVPGLVEVLPRFEEMVADHTPADGTLDLPGEVTARRLLQQAAREDQTERGMAVTALTDSQMSDYQGLRNSKLAFFALTRQEPKVANFHTALDAWLDEAAA